MSWDSPATFRGLVLFVTAFFLWKNIDRLSIYCFYSLPKAVLPSSLSSVLKYFARPGEIIILNLIIIFYLTSLIILVYSFFSRCVSLLLYIRADCYLLEYRQDYCALRCFVLLCPNSFRSLVSKISIICLICCKLQHKELLRVLLSRNSLLVKHRS